MKSQLIDKFSKRGRLGSRLQEILSQVEAGRISRMDAGDLIGRQIVAALEAGSARDRDAAALLFDAQVTRARLYQESQGATPLEAAEALAEASALLPRLGSGREHRERLVDPAWKILHQLVAIGSRRTSWACLAVLVDAVEDSERFAELRPRVVEAVVDLTDALAGDEGVAGALETALRVHGWSRAEDESQHAELVARLPVLLGHELDDLAVEPALRAYLVSRHHCAHIDQGVVERLVLRLVEEGRCDTEARQVYREFLADAPERRAHLEGAFRELAAVHADPSKAYDPDLDALQGIAAEVWGQTSVWPWRNRALMLRRKNDLAGAVSCLARVMNATGAPSDLVGIMAPVLHRLGFQVSAKAFANFAPEEERRRFRLRILDRLAAEPGGERGCRNLVRHLERDLADPQRPPEFGAAIRLRLADLLVSLGRAGEARPHLLHVLEQDPTEALAAVKLAELEFLDGRTSQALRRLDADLGARVAPQVLFLRARIAAAAGDTDEALRHLDAAREALPAAQQAGREERQKSWLVVRQRAATMHGAEVAEGAMISMLGSDVHAAPHPDLARLEPELDRLTVELAARGGRSEAAIEALARIASRHPGDRRAVGLAVRGFLEFGAPADAAALLDRLAEADVELDAELLVLRGLVELECGDRESAEATFVGAMERFGGPVAALALAALRIESGRDAEALELLRGIAPAAPESVRSRAACLLGVLLERAGDAEAALAAHEEAARLGGGSERAERRAGVLGVKIGLGRPDDALVARSLARLERFRDPGSVEAAALARAHLARSAEEAVRSLEIDSKRVGPRAALGLRRVQLRRLLEAERLPEAARVLRSLREECDSADLASLEGWLLRRRVLDLLSGIDPRDTAALAAVGDELVRADDADPRSELRLLARIVRHLVRPQGALKGIHKDSSEPLVLAVALASAPRAPAPAVLAGLERIAEAGGRWSRLARELGALFDPGRLPEIETWQASAAGLGCAWPFDRGDLVRLGAIRRVLADRRAEPPEEAPEDVRAWARLSLLVRDPEAWSLPVLLESLAACSEGPGGKAFVAARRHIQRLVSEAREMPSPEWASARLRVAGKRSRVFLPAVLEFWRRELEEGRRVDEARHQIALLSLARAHEAEAAGQEAEEDWIEAHEAWRALLEADSFWEGFARGGSDPAALARLREAIAAWLVGAHVARAEFMFASKKLAHAMRHARIACSSPLLERAGAPAIRERVFDVFAGDMERRLQARDFAGAIERLDHVLLCDPDSARARREMLGAVAAAIRQPFAMLDAFTREPDAGTLAELGSVLRKHLVLAERRIVEWASDAAERDPHAADDLAVALRGLAFLRFHDDRRGEDAVRLCELGLAVAPEGSPVAERLRAFRSRVGLQLVSVAVARAEVDGDPFDRALRDVDDLLATDPGNVRILEEKVKLLTACGRDDEAEELARHLFEKSRKNGDPEILRRAVELLEQVRSGRESFRFSSQTEMIASLIERRNFRAAHQLFREAAIGRENAPEFLLMQARILLGLHKVRQADEVLDKLRGHREVEGEWRSLVAHTAFLKHMVARGGDLYSAFELWERGDLRRCQGVLQQMSAADCRDVGARLLNAVCQVALVGAERAGSLVSQARDAADEQRAAWAKRLLDQEIGE